MAIILPNSGLAGVSAASKASLIASLKAGEYNLFLGAGVCLDATNGAGDNLPSGAGLKSDLCKITGANPSSTLQRVFSGLTPDQIRTHITQRFQSCSIGPSVEKLSLFVWRRIFTINIDNVIERAYTRAGSLQHPRVFHFKDTYVERRSQDEVPIVHLHGQAEQPERGYVFSRSEYARIMVDANAWMTVLAEIMPVEPFVISGTSLDEVDLEFYLARRNSSSPREDRGPSFFVEPFPDGQTERECEAYGLTLYKGTFENFLVDLDRLVPHRDGPFALVAASTRELFPTNTKSQAVISFSMDFDRVPNRLISNNPAIKFAYGNPPEWNDLAAGWDVGRGLTSRVKSIIEAMAARQLPERLLIILDDTAVGKTTVLRRVGYDLSATGTVVLNCSALSRIDAKVTSSTLDLIDVPIVVLVDNFADQAAAIAAILSSVEKTDIVFLGAERRFRTRHIVRSLGDLPYRTVDGLELNGSEATQLTSSYVKRGLTNSEDANKQPQTFASRLVGEPIAVACCHIINDFRPLDRIVESMYQAANAAERSRYLIAALAQHCFSPGVRYEILAAAAGRIGWNAQFDSGHALPLDYFDGDRKDFIVPLNATLAERTLERAPSVDIANTFRLLALGIAPRVNRESIRNRVAEARLAGRLFDYEDVIKRFLGKEAGAFYSVVQPAWQWNSRYWEQLALYYLARFKTERDEILLRQAVQHARHAKSIEPHPFSWTTLGKVLLAQMGLPGISNAGTYSEAHNALAEAIRLERQRGRASVHAYVTLFRGALDYLRLGNNLTDDQFHELETLTSAAARYFPHDPELRQLADEVSRTI